MIVQAAMVASMLTVTLPVDSPALLARDLKSKVMAHWHPDCTFASQISVHFLVDAEGKLIARPTILAKNDPAHINAEAAVRAVYEAAPFGPLPFRDIVLHLTNTPCGGAAG